MPQFLFCPNIAQRNIGWTVESSSLAFTLYLTLNKLPRLCKCLTVFIVVEIQLT